MRLSKEKTLEALLFLAVIISVLSWFSVRHVQSRWTNVPPAPGKVSLVGSALGDQQLAYRMVGVMLQNLGDTGGRSTPLRNYDYAELSKWLHLTNELDTRSNFVPYLAAMYFGSVDVPENLPPLLEYLHLMGQNPGGEHWRWLAHATYLARFQLNDLDLALKYARTLAAIPRDDMPAWTKQMPAFILNAKGNKEEALAVMVQIIKSGEGKLEQSELNHTLEVICTRILDPAEAKGHPLCEDVLQ